jgi:hypothetical protein
MLVMIANPFYIQNSGFACFLQVTLLIDKAKPIAK